MDNKKIEMLYEDIKRINNLFTVIHENLVNDNYYEDILLKYKFKSFASEFNKLEFGLHKLMFKNIDTSDSEDTEKNQ